MRKLIVPFFLLAAAVSCREPLFDPMPRWMHENGRHLHQERQDAAEEGGLPGESGATGERPLQEYLTAFQFPEEVPWRDSVVTEGAELVLYKNGEETLRVPVQGTPEPDRHRVVEGHLWTDACENGFMVVSCDGAERFRYPGEELYRGFLVLDGRVHTLGQRPGQEGFCYRIDGKEVYSSAIGTIAGAPDSPDWPGGAFSTDEGAVFYTYALPVRLAGSYRWEYHVMQGDELLQTLPAGETDRIFDIRVFRGDVYRCERKGASAGGMRMVHGSQVEALAFPDEEVPHACTLVPEGDRMLVKGYSTVPGRQPYRCWYREGARSLFLDCGALPLLELYRLPDGTVAAVFLDPVDGRRVDTITLDKERLPLPPGSYRMEGPRCATFHDGRFSVALSSAEGTSHHVLHACADSLHTDTYTFNGYFTSLQYQ